MIFAEAAASRPISVLMYSHDGVGLGHMRRNSAIAARLVGEVAAANVLMLVGCPSGLFFDLPQGVDSVKLPSILKTATNSWRPRNPGFPTAVIKRLRADLILKTAEVLSPRLFLVDHMPAGVWHELLPTLRHFRSLADPPAVILGLRDVLDSPEVVRETWRREGVYDVIADYYDGIYVYGRRDIFDMAALYGLGPRVAGKLRHHGYLCADQRFDGAEDVRERLGINGERLVVVTGGGGHDAFPMMMHCMEAFRRLGPGPRPEAVFVTGPLMDEGQRAELRDSAAGLPIRVIDCVRNIASYFSAADLVITMGGYNTLMDAIRLGKPSIVLPRSGPSTEQMTRAKAFHDLGLVRTMLPDEMDPARLADLIQEQLTSGRAPRAKLELDGLSNAVQALKGLLRVDQEAGPAPLPVALASA